MPKKYTRLELARLIYDEETPFPDKNPTSEAMRWAIQILLQEFTRQSWIVLNQQSIRVPFSEEDIQDLQAWEEFVWNFPDQDWICIEVHVVQETAEDVWDTGDEDDN